MKTIKQKFLHSKFATLAVLLFAFILLISVGFMPRKASAEETKFDPNNFVMCEGAEVRTDGDASGIRFVAKLGDTSLPEYTNLTYNVMIVPQAYIDHYEITGDWYTALKAKMEADETLTNKTIITMQTKPFYSSEVVAGEKGNYIRGTLSNVKYDNINVEWFGIAYITYEGTNVETGEKTTEYIYAQIPETGANVRSLVYCASGYLNVYDYSSEEKAAEKEVLTNFVAQGINKAVGNVAEENKNDRTYLNQGIQAIAKDASDTLNLFPEDTAEWTTGVPTGVNMHVVYGAEDEKYASISEAGVITGVEGDNTAETTKYVTMKALGTTYQKPVHVYTVTAELSNETTEIFSKGGVFGDTTFVDSTELNVTAQVDGKDVENTVWVSTNTSVATVENGEVVAVFKNTLFESETVGVSFTFEFEGKVFESNECSVKVSFPIAYKTAPIAYGDLMQKVFTEENALEETTEDINTASLGEGFGTVTSFISEDLEKEMLVDGKTNANVYGTKEAGEKKFIVVSENGYAYMVKATVVNYAIGNDTAELDYFFNSYKADTTSSEDGSLYSTKGTYVILSADVEDYVRSPIHDQSTYYAGTFDGRGHAIKYKTYDGTIPSSAWTKSGMFGVYVSRFATIKNTAFIGLLKNSSAGGGLTNKLSGVVDNCYVSITMNGTSSAQGGVCAQNASGTIQNTIVYVMSSKSSSTTNKGTLSNTITEKGVVENCFSIGVDNKIIYNVAGSKDDSTLAFDIDGLKEKIGSELPATYNSYWNLTDTVLSFGGTTLLEFTASATQN